MLPDDAATRFIAILLKYAPDYETEAPAIVSVEQVQKQKLIHATLAVQAVFRMHR